MRASAQELLQAYLEAVRRNDANTAFWRANLLERMESINVAIRDSEGLAGADSDDPQGSGSAL